MGGVDGRKDARVRAGPVGDVAAVFRAGGADVELLHFSDAGHDVLARREIRSRPAGPLIGFSLVTSGPEGIASVEDEEYDNRRPASDDAVRQAGRPRHPHSCA